MITFTEESLKKLSNSEMRGVILRLQREIKEMKPFLQHKEDCCKNSYGVPIPELEGHCNCGLKKVING